MVARLLHVPCVSARVIILILLGEIADPMPLGWACNGHQKLGKHGNTGPAVTCSDYCQASQLVQQHMILCTANTWEPTWCFLLVAFGFCATESWREAHWTICSFAGKSSWKCTRRRRSWTGTGECPSFPSLKEKKEGQK